ncbi:MAG: archaellin/type IV pilin N-terminal domain-containing protein [archaeon]
MESVLKLNNKKGLSPVVATIAILMITVVAAGIIAGIVVPLVRDRLSDSTECIGYEDYFTFYEEFEYNCYKIIDDGVENYSIIALSVGADTVSNEKVESLGGMRLAFLGDGSSIPVDVSDDLDASPEKGKIRMLKTADLKLALPERGGVKTYVYNASGTYDSVEVYPVLKSGKQCDMTDSIRIKGHFCRSDLNLTI